FRSASSWGDSWLWDRCPRTTSADSSASRSASSASAEPGRFRRGPFSPIPTGMQYAAAASPFFGADPATPETEALLEAGRLSTLGELVRGVAHEINNPLFGMLGLVDLLLADLEPGSPEHNRLRLAKQSGA